MTTEPEGGESACFAHLLTPTDTIAPIAIAAILGATDGTGPIWSHRATDLDLNVVSITPAKPILPHTNAERDVLLVGLEGTGTITISDAASPFGAGMLVVVPKGAVRSVVASTPRMAWLTCHTHRPHLFPTIGPRPKKSAE